MNIFDVLRDKLEEASFDGNERDVTLYDAIEIVNQVEQEYNNIRYFKCSYYDTYRCEHVITIVKANSKKEAYAALEKIYTNTYVYEWDCEEMTFSKHGTCEVYYGR